MSQRNQPSARSWQRISIALMGALLAASLVYGVLSSQPPHYQSRAILFANNAGLAVDWPRWLDTYTHLLRTPATLQAALDTAQSPLSADALSSAMSLESLPNTQLIALNVSSTIATQPQALADALAQQLIAENARLTDTPDVLALKKQLTDLQTQLDATHAESQTLDTQIAAARDPAVLSDLRSRRSDALLRYVLLQSDYSTLFIRQNALPRGSPELRIANAASPAILIATLPLWESVIAAALIGGGLGVGVSTLIGALDNTLRSPEAIRRGLGLTVLSAIPPLRFKPGDDRLIFQADAPHAEPYQKLAKAIQNSGTCRVIAVTSAGMGEGKSLIAANLSIALAQAGHRVLIIDADLRTPTQHKWFKLSNRDGLTTLLYEAALRPASDAASDIPLHTLKRTPIDGLSVLTSGPLPPNPAEIVGSVQMLEVVRKLAEQFELVVIDTPPVRATSDTLTLAPNLEGVLFVVDAQHTQRRAARMAMRQLRQVNAQMIGAVLNRSRRTV